MRSANKKLTAFGKLVVKALADRDMTKAQLAERVGTSPQYLGSTEKSLYSHREALKT